MNDQNCVLIFARALSWGRSPEVNIGFYRKLDKWTEAAQPAKEPPQKAANFTYPSSP